MLSWDCIEERLVAAENYWIATVRPDARPHVTPVWGLWVEEASYFGSGPQTRKTRDLLENPTVAVHPEGEDVVVLEGVVEVIATQDPALAERLFAASTAKYGTGSRDIRSYAGRPHTEFASAGDGFPDTATRFRFGRD